MLRSYLTKLYYKAEKPFYPFYGLCDAVKGNFRHEHKDNTVYEVFEHVMHKYNQYWEHWSGSYTFPIPGPEGKNECNAYVEVTNKWDLNILFSDGHRMTKKQKREYIQKRWDYTKFIIDCIDKELEL